MSKEQKLLEIIKLQQKLIEKQKSEKVEVDEFDQIIANLKSELDDSKNKLDEKEKEIKQNEKDLEALKEEGSKPKDLMSQVEEFLKSE